MLGVQVSALLAEEVWLLTSRVRRRRDWNEAERDANAQANGFLGIAAIREAGAEKGFVF